MRDPHEMHGSADDDLSGDEWREAILSTVEEDPW